MSRKRNRNAAYGTTNMGGGLTSYINSDYVSALNKLNGAGARKKIVAYVESYNDIFFWSNLLRPLENEKFYFEVMLPSNESLGKGKKIAIGNQLGDRLGGCMIACVDADYDYLIEGSTPTSVEVCSNKYIFHTYVYAIENFQCYAPSLHGVCVMATLNDHRIFDFESFLTAYSRIIWPLFVWNVWAYRYGQYKKFSLLDFFNIVGLNDVNLYHPEAKLNALQHRVNAKISRLYKEFPEGKKTYKPLRDELLQKGLTPETTYLYMRGHDLQDGIVTPLMTAVCERLRREREREIRNNAVHRTQFQNELSGYQHSTAAVEEMMRKQTGYTAAPQYQQIIANIKDFLAAEGLLELGESVK
ncbi:DUF4435 domain-containing protein [Pseudoprevotella muciniphila]|nr:DUF4435 domain-containing protein [Pseudoprevotella muciniphila]